MGVVAGYSLVSPPPGPYESTRRGRAMAALLPIRRANMDMDIPSLLASIPTPTADDMLARRDWAREYTLVCLRRGPAPRDDEARNERLQLEHLQHLTKLQMLGKLVLNGPILIDHDILGVSVYAAGLDEARALAEADPKVVAGYLTVEAIPWMAVPHTEARD
jgi:uncharacterized protein YciI